MRLLLSKGPCRTGGPTTTRFTRTRLSDIVHPVSSSRLTQDPECVRSFGGYNKIEVYHISPSGCGKTCSPTQQRPYPICVTLTLSVLPNVPGGRAADGHYSARAADMLAVWWLGPAVHQAKQGLRHCWNRAESDFATVRAVARAVPLRTVNGRLRGWLGPAVLDRLLLGGQTNRASDGTAPSQALLSQERSYKGLTKGMRCAVGLGHHFLHSRKPEAAAKALEDLIRNPRQQPGCKEK